MSEIKKAQQAKQVIIDEIKEKLSRAKSAVVIDYIGINVEQADKMRKELREADVDYFSREPLKELNLNLWEKF